MRKIFLPCLRFYETGLQRRFQWEHIFDNHYKKCVIGCLRILEKYYTLSGKLLHTVIVRMVHAF
jgi:hypothetical protein